MFHLQKAKKWLDEHGVEYVDRDITTENPRRSSFAEWHARSELPLRRLFNTSGMKYRELALGEARRRHDRRRVFSMCSRPMACS